MKTPYNCNKDYTSRGIHIKQNSLHFNEASFDNCINSY